MDDLNNHGNGFEEESFADSERKAEEAQNVNPTYNQPVDPYNQPQNTNPYNNVPNTAQQPQNPYNMPNTTQQPQNPYAAQNPQQQAPNQYAQPDPQQFDPYKQPYPPQQGYNGYNGYNNGQPPYGMPMQGTYPTGMATASMVLGIISIVIGIFMFIFPPLFLLPIAGIVLGIIYKSKHYPVGKGMSTAGIITSVLALVGAILFFVLLLVLAFSPDLMYQLIEIVKEASPSDYQELYDEYYKDFPEWFEGASALFFNLFK